MKRTGNQKFEYFVKYTQIYMGRGKQERERERGIEIEEKWLNVQISSDSSL